MSTYFQRMVERGVKGHPNRMVLDPYREGTPRPLPARNQGLAHLCSAERSSSQGEGSLPRLFSAVRPDSPELGSRHATAATTHRSFELSSLLCGCPVWRSSVQLCGAPYYEWSRCVFGGEEMDSKGRVKERDDVISFSLSTFKCQQFQRGANNGG